MLTFLSVFEPFALALPTILMSRPHKDAFREMPPENRILIPFRTDHLGFPIPVRGAGMCAFKRHGHITTPTLAAARRPCAPLGSLEADSLPDLSNRLDLRWSVHP